MTQRQGKHRQGGGRRRGIARALGLDHVWVRRWQRLRLPPRVERALLTFVRLGDGWGWLCMTLLLALVLPRERFLFVAGQGLCAAAVSVPLYGFLKATIRRTRPYMLFKSIVPRVSPRDVYSFPSGHTMNNLAIFVALAVHLPWLWPLAFAIPIATGLLRVLFGVHFVSDIAGGTLLGLLAGGVSVWLYPVILSLVEGAGAR